VTPQVFEGWIAGIGTTSGFRLVAGHWPVSPYGPMSDVMVEAPDGHRVLLAPTREIAEFVAATYVFDEVRVVPVEVVVDGRHWRVNAGPLRLQFRTGGRGPLGLLLRSLPPRLARSPRWVALLDRPARVVLRGVRTSGSARGGRREWYGARDLHPVVAAAAEWDGADLGALAAVEPPVRFGFGSVPRRPSLVRVITTVDPEPARG